MIAAQWGFDRAAVDEFSLGSHEKDAAAQDSGAFGDQIVAIKDQDGNPVLKDEGIRRGTTIEKMAELKPGVQGGRRDPRGQLVTDLRRLGRAAVHVGR
jgi:acetyl-CoA acyltransferase